MSVTIIIACTTLITSVVTIAYAVLITNEVRKGKRIARKFRGYLDDKICLLFGKVGKGAEVVGSLYRKGSDEVEKDLIDPVAKPIVDTRHKYIMLKTGERRIRRVGLSKTSPHLQKLLQKNRQFNSKKRSGKFRKKLALLRKEVQRQNKEQGKEQVTDEQGYG